jgi:hypothetical protein
MLLFHNKKSTEKGRERRSDAASRHCERATKKNARASDINGVSSASCLPSPLPCFACHPPIPFSQHHHSPHRRFSGKRGIDREDGVLASGPGPACAHPLPGHYLLQRQGTSLSPTIPPFLPPNRSSPPPPCHDTRSLHRFCSLTQRALLSIPFPSALPPSLQYTFPSQPSVLAALSRIAEREKAERPSTVFYVGTYSIGKERAVRAVAAGIGEGGGGEGGREGGRGCDG